MNHTTNDPDIGFIVGLVVFVIVVAGIAWGLKLLAIVPSGGIPISQRLVALEQAVTALEQQAP